MSKLIMTNRRNFLKLSAFSVGSLGLFDASNNAAFAAITPGEDDYKSLVIINLNGGNDSLNMLIPNTQTEYEQYAQARPKIAFDKSALLPITPDGYGIDSFALSPRMPEARELFNNGDLSFIANVGSLIQPITKSQFLDPLRTQPRPVGLGGHNTQAAYWQADHSNRINTSKDGWGGRLANEFNADAVLPTNISINSGHTVFQSHASQKFYNVGLSGLISLEDFRNDSTNPGIRARRKAVAALNRLASDSPNVMLKHAGQLFTEGLDLNLALQGSLSTITQDLSNNFPAPASFSGSAFASSLARTAELIKVRRQLGMKRQIFFLELAGFDNHSSHAQNHGNLSQDLSQYLKAFNDIISADDELRDSVVTMTTSEFGRNLASNGDGTDHAWGAQHIVMGGPVDGGKIFGTYPSLELDGDDDYNGLGRMIPTLSITQYGATIAKWFGVPDNDISSVFPNIVNFSADQRDIGFIT
jgi:uncharacterized protein (DUF1501 family)